MNIDGARRDEDARRPRCIENLLSRIYAKWGFEKEF
jgi:hypothetical protein